MWTSHRVIVELADKAYWFWNAPKDAHGTTMNEIALTHPTSYRQYVNNAEGEKRAQWTRVMVMPHAVVAAVRRQGEIDDEWMSEEGETLTSGSDNEVVPESELSPESEEAF